MGFNKVMNRSIDNRTKKPTEIIFRILPDLEQNKNGISKLPFEVRIGRVAL